MPLLSPDVLQRVVVVGAGQAGSTLAASLRSAGWRGPIDLVDSEGGDLYQRPPLSKEYLKGAIDEDGLITRTRAVLQREQISYHAGATATAIDRVARVVHLDDGAELPYDIAVLATGARPRALPIDGSDLAGVHVLRTRSDAAALRASLREVRNVVVLGGGFLGLEIASSAAQSAKVVVIERAPELLQRSLSGLMARQLADHHRAEGTQLLIDEGVCRLLGTGRVSGVELDNGKVLPAELVIISVGAQPNVELAVDAGLAVSNGVVVDSELQTSDPHIYAIGDCANFPHPHAGQSVRLESVQNAVDQGRHLGGRLAGQGEGGYRAVPWFWSHQAGQNLQIVGVAQPDDQVIPLRAEPGRAIVARVRDGLVTAVETLNAPRVHRRARAMLADGPVEVPDWSALLDVPAAKESA